MSGSAACSAWVFLITLVTIIYRSTGEPSQLIVCSQPDSFTVQITENEYVAHDTELLIKYSPHVGLFLHPETNLVNILLNETVIEFKGYTSPEYPAIQPDLSPERLSWNASGIILGIGTLQKLSSENYAVRKCRLFLPTNIKSSANLPKSVEVKVIHDALFCARKHLCERIEMMKLKNISRHNEYEPNMLRARVFRSSRSNAEAQISINALADIILKQVIKYIKQSGKSVIKIPNVIETHNMRFGMKYHFKAINGSFEDLSTLRRTDDAIISTIGKTHVKVQVGFGISLAKFSYDYYKLNMGFISIDGKLSGIIERLAITTRLVIEHGDTCNVNIDYIKITEFGKLNLKMTGMGLLNKLTSNILTWLTKIWQDKIVKAIEINARDIIKQQLNKLCEDQTRSKQIMRRDYEIYIVPIL